MPGHDASQVIIHLRVGEDRIARAGVSGIYRCGSPWLCPTCAPARAQVRADRVQRAAKATYRRSGAVALVVLTASHKLATPLADIKALVAGASRKVRQGRAWQDLVDEHGVLGVVVGQEVTISKVNGWHYHQHLSVLVDGRDGDDVDAARDRAQAAGNAIADRYKAMIRAAGGNVSSKRGCLVRVADDADDASRYTAKGSSAWEVAGGHKDETKSKASMTPWDLAESAYRGLKDGDDASAEDRWARARWSEYVEVMPGTRSCVVSASLAKSLGIEAADDGETGEQVLHQREEIVGRVPVAAWRIWMAYGLVASFLARIEADGEIGCAGAIAATSLIADRIDAAKARRHALEAARVADDAAARKTAIHGHLVSEVARRVQSGSGAGTITAIERGIAAISAACPGTPPPTVAEVIAALQQAA